MNGFLNIYKPKGMSSAHCLNKIKKKLDYKCGHMGTLDPLASGILPIGVGQASRLFDHLLDKKKVYIAEFTFGYETTTLDREGEIIKSDGKIPTKDEIINVLPNLCGKVMQIPPIFSAKCVDGKKSYELARKGISVELKPKEIEIFHIKLIEDCSPKFKLEICCGGGTYIRAIARDLAYALGTFATMTELERIQSGYFTMQNCTHLDDFLKALDPCSFLIKSDEPLTYEKLVLNAEQSTRLINGLKDDYDIPNGKYRVYAENEFWGVGICEDNKLTVKPYVRG
ncbi:MAG: tRNA pseudouridine(55) synthase TruB [Clostridia bacterium]|nr:tRNA pseudouridine(55) synthase TruB [Clostridia bacterium]